MKVLILFASLMWLGNVSLCQSDREKNDSLELRGRQFYLEGYKIKRSALANFMVEDSEASNYLSKARTNATIVDLTLHPGLFFLVWSSGDAIFGNRMDWSMFGVGTGLFASSIIFERAFRKNARMAVKSYNSDPNKGRKVGELNLGINPHGLGFSYNF